MVEIYLAEQVIEFGLDNEESTEYVGAASHNTPLEESSTYTVVWDGTLYECACVSIDGMCVIGNTSAIVEGTGNNEPFFCYYDAVSESDNPVLVFVTEDTSASHTIAIYSGVLEEEKAGANIVLFDRNGNEVTYEGIETVTFNTDVEGETATYTHGTVPDEVPEVAVDFTDGNQIVNAETGKLIKSVVIKKPETLLAENIKKGVEVAGVLGEFIGDEMEKTVELAMVDGDQVIEADADTFMAKVTVKKPETLIPENIAKDVDIGGVVGTFEGSSGGLSIGDYRVRVIDYDGSLIAEQYCNSGDVFTLPDAPTHDRLVFDGWSSPVEIVGGAITVGTSNVIIGAMYHTASGATECDVYLNAKIGLTVEFNNVLTGYTSIDWGDGAVNTSLSHTYADHGEYTIKIYGMTDISDCTSSKPFIASDYKNCLKQILFANTVISIGTYAFYSNKSLKNVVLPNSITTINANAFSYCSSITSIIIPNSITKVSNYIFYYCYALANVVIPKNVSSIGNYAFQFCSSLRTIILPETVTHIYERAFSECASLRNISLPDSVKSMGNYAFERCYSLESVKIPSGLTSIPNQAFYYCCAMANVVIPSSVTLIWGSVFNSCYALNNVDLSQHTSVPELAYANGFDISTSTLKIKVPASLYDEWIAATNWTTFADYIVAV